MNEKNGVAVINNEGAELTPYGIFINNIQQLNNKGVGIYINENNIKNYKALLIPIRDNDKLGFIDKAGKVIITPQYDRVRGDFLNIYSLVVVVKNGLYGAVDIKGNVIIPIVYKDLCPFQEGENSVGARNENYEYGIINRNNVAIIPFGKYEWCDYHFTNGYARVKRNNKWGIVNKKDEIVIDIIYDNIWTLSKKYPTRLELNEERKTIQLPYIVPDEFNVLDIDKIRSKFIEEDMRLRGIHPDHENEDSLTDKRGFTQDEVDSGLADAFEGDYDAYLSRQ